MTAYLLVRAAAFSLLLEAALVEVVTPGVEPEDGVDISRALGGGPADVTVTLGPGARVRQLGFDSAHGLVDLAEDALAPLPGPIAAAAGQDVDAVTRTPLDGRHAFRLKLARSSAATAG